MIDRVDLGIFDKIRGAAFSLVLVPGMAFGGGWDVFVDRCLMPMSEVMAADVSGLEGASVDRLAAHFEAEALAAMQIYAVDDGTTLALQPGDYTDTPTCLVLTDECDARVAADIWLGQETGRDAWEPVGNDEYLSTTWREPKLHFALIDPDGPHLILALTETDLES